MATFRRARSKLVLLLVVIAILAGLGVVGYRNTTQVPALDGVAVLDVVPADVPGYDRSCSTGRGCVFGPAWSDDVSVRLGHNGCDTRNDILREKLTAVIFKQGTSNCVVTSGTLRDPYTDQVIEFAKADAEQIQIDHVYPLAVAWDRGAWNWTADRRRDFANDPDNLTATTAAANQSKSDKTPASWLPSYEGGRCAYLAKFVSVARKYQLPVTTAEARVITACM